MIMHAQINNHTTCNIFLSKYNLIINNLSIYLASLWSPIDSMADKLTSLCFVNYCKTYVLYSNTWTIQKGMIDKTVKPCTLVMRFPAASVPSAIFTDTHDTPLSIF